MTKVCINCHTESPLDEVFCPECGMSLRRAATGEEAARLKGEKTTTPEQPPTASGIVYLFGEQFARPWRGIADEYVNRYVGPQLQRIDDRSLIHPIRAPYSGQDVWRGDLAIRLLESGFIHLVHERYISLRVEKRKGLLRATEAVAIALETSGEDMPPSLEKAIMGALRGDPKDDWVKSVVGRVIGGRRWDPSQKVVDMVLESLVETGWMCRPAVPVVETTAPLLGELDAVKSRVHSFASQLPHLHQTLLSEVQAGILSRFL